MYRIEKCTYFCKIKHINDTIGLAVPIYKFDKKIERAILNITANSEGCFYENVFHQTCYGKEVQSHGRQKSKTSVEEKENGSEDGKYF